MPQESESLPDLPDMIDCGLGLTEALAFWSRMMNQPQVPAREWWEKLRSLRPLPQ